MSGATRLRAGALDFSRVTVIGIASAAPGYSLAAALGLITASCGLAMPAMLLLAFVPMACIASAFDQFNRVDADCGTSFSWVTRAFGPTAGWLTGWAVIAADVVVMASLAQIAAQYSLALVGIQSAQHGHLTLVLGALWIAAMTWVCCRGIAFSARIQAFLLVLEIGVLLVLAALMLRAPHGPRPSLSWFWPRGLAIRKLLDGLGVAIFIYWGWDTALNVNAESHDPQRTPGRAALVSTVVLLGIFVLTGAAALGWAGPELLVAHQEDVLAALGVQVFGKPWDKILHVVVLTSAIAAAQTTILPTARTLLSMAEKRALPRYFAAIDPVHAVPARATLWMGVVSIAWYVGLSLCTTTVVAASLDALNLLVAFYYALTGLACAWYFRREFIGLLGFVQQIAAPLTGSLMLLGLMAYLVIAPDDRLAVAMAAGLMALGLGVLALQRHRDGSSGFWRR